MPMDNPMPENKVALIVVKKYSIVTVKIMNVLEDIETEFYRLCNSIDNSTFKALNKEDKEELLEKGYFKSGSNYVQICEVE